MLKNARMQIYDLCGRIPRIQPAEECAPLRLTLLKIIAGMNDLTINAGQGLMLRLVKLIPRMRLSERKLTESISAADKSS